jgi:hypothetical protein
MVEVARVKAHDPLSGVAAGSPDITVSSNGGRPSDVSVRNGVVRVRASHTRAPGNRIYTIVAEATDRAGNTATSQTTCVVRDRR